MTPDLITSETRINIQEIQRRFFRSNVILREEKKYLENCFEVLFNDVLNYFGNDLILFDAFSLDQKKDILNIGESLYNKNNLYKPLVDTLNLRYHQSISELIAHSRKDNSFVSISSELILKNKETAICLFRSPLGVLQINHKDCLSINIDKVLPAKVDAFDKQISIFDIFELSDYVHSDRELKLFCKSLGTSQTKSYGLKNTIILYKSYLNRLNSAFAYFIRPRVVHGDYDGVMLIFIKRELTESEFNILSSILKDILSEIALAKSLEREWESIVNEQNHTAKHTLNALGVQVASLLEFPEVYNNAITRSIVNKANIHIYTINKTNDYLLSMMRVQGGSKKVYEILEIRGINLKSVLLNIVEIIEVTLFALGLSNNESKKREIRIKEKCIPLLRKSINLLPNIGIQVGRIGFEIVLIELLKNAVFHTDNEKPKVEVFLKNEKNKKFATLHIMNNIGVSKDQFDFINKGINRDNISKQYKSGVRTVKRILEFEGFSYSRTKWNIKISKHSLYPSGTTDIFLKIPKSDIYE